MCDAVEQEVTINLARLVIHGKKRKKAKKPLTNFLGVKNSTGK